MYKIIVVGYTGSITAECHCIITHDIIFEKKHTFAAGFRWQRQLVFRSKLTMHTAFERKDNKEPAAVTAIAISK